jgi:RND family efflux transporter MFP subunit
MLTGEIAPAFQMDLKSEVGGKVKAINVEAGQFVKKGDVLVVVDDTDLLIQKASAETEVYGAELQMQKTKGNFERAEKLFEAKLISKEVYANLKADYEIVQNSLKKAKSSLDSVKDKLSKTKILAPADGTILDVLVIPGQVIIAAASVNSGSSLITFADLSKLIINGHINQMDVAKVSVGHEISVSVNQEHGKKFKAKVDFIAPLATVKNNLKGFEMQATVVNPDDSLKPGINVRMTIPVASANNALSVPISAVFTENDERVVYVRRGEATMRRKVTVGVTDLSHAEITSGLQEGEEILLIDPKNIKS